MEAVTARRRIKLCAEWKTKRRRVKWRRMSVWIGGEIKREKRERENEREKHGKRDSVS